MNVIFLGKHFYFVDCCQAKIYFIVLPLRNTSSNQPDIFWWYPGILQPGQRWWRTGLGTGACCWWATRCIAFCHWRRASWLEGKRRARKQRDLSSSTWMKRTGSRSYLKVGETGDDDRGCRTGRTGREVKMGEMQRLEVSDYSARTIRIAN